MHPNTRACIAFVAAELISFLNSRSVYDHSRSIQIKIDGTVSDSVVSIHDEERQCVLKGDSSHLYDDIRKTVISLNIKGSRFGGCDFGDHRYFSGYVNGKSVVLYDYGESAYFNYSV